MRTQQRTLRSSGHSLIHSAGVYCASTMGQALGWVPKRCIRHGCFPQASVSGVGQQSNTHSFTEHCYVPGTVPSTGMGQHRQGPKSEGSHSTLHSMINVTAEGTLGCHGYIEGVSGPTWPRAGQSGFPEALLSWWRRGS